MTDNSAGENNIESLAARAKEVLDRVRANTDDEPTPVPDVEANVPDVEANVPDDGLGDIALPEPSVLPASDPGEPPTDIAGLIEGDLAELDDTLNAELDDTLNAELDDTLNADLDDTLNADIDLDVNADIDIDEDDLASMTADDGIREAETNSPEVPLGGAALSTSLVPTDTFDAESLRSEDGEEEDDRRKYGCLLPLLLLALLILALLYLVTEVFGDDDDPSLVNGSSTDVTQPEVEANDVQSSSTASTASTDAPSTTETPTTSATTTTTTTTTEAPVVIPANTWELLGASSETDLFAAFGEPFGLRDVLEQPGGTEFTVLAPSNEAISALSQEAIGGFANDPASAEALLGYHIIDQRLTPDALLAAAGGQLQSRVGLPIDVSIDGDDIVLNGTSRVSLEALEAENGNVLVIDSVLAPPTINSVINLGDVQFEVISAIITDSGKAELQKAVAFFEENPDANAVIEGHTDTDGPSEPNQRLSERRAVAVRDFLIAEGIDGSRLTAEGFGESQPIIVNGVEDKAASRRIEFNIR